MWKNLIIKKWDKYNRLTIIKEVVKKWKSRRFQCKCICWNIKEVSLWHLRWWHTKSCWCLRITNPNSKTHWMSNTSIYNIYINIIQRCDNENSTFYQRYWWRWITYTKKWETFEWFYEDMGTRPKWKTIDRKDNNKWYSKDNCRWATMKEQQRNKNNNRLYKWKCISQWCEELWLSSSLVRQRVDRDWFSYEKALELT